LNGQKEEDMEDTGSVSVSRPTSIYLRPVLPIAAATLIIAVTIVHSSGPAAAKPEFAVKTGLQCGRCHVSPGGGGKLTPFGEAFKANGLKVPKTKK
jgi:hypothetical protein